MKRYLVFSGQLYYPRGGWRDFVDAFEDRQQAEAKFAESLKCEEWDTRWAHIYDSVTEQIVADMTSQTSP